MTDDKLNELLKQIAAPPVDEAAKRRAIDAAMAEFTAHQRKNTRVTTPERQGFQPRFRPIRDDNENGRSKIMALLSKNKMFYGGVATACVTLLGLILVFQIGLHESLDMTPQVDSRPPAMSPPAELPPVDPERSVASVPLAEPEAASEQPAAPGPVSPAMPPPAELPPVDPERSVASLLLAEPEAASEQPVAPEPASPAMPPPAELPPADPEHSVASVPLAEPGVASEQQADIQTFDPGTDFSEDRLGVLFNDPSINNNYLGANQSYSDLEATDVIPPPSYRETGRDRFENFQTNPIKLVSEEPVSTFSIDVDTASYSFVRRQLNQGLLPEKDAVRVEEMINYFDYDYPLPESKQQPFQASVVITPSPWAEGKQLMHIGIKGYDIDPAEQPDSNLVFLLDVSGSMDSPDKLPLVKQSMGLLLDSLKPEDTVGIVVYAGAAGKVLRPTPVKEKPKILAALDRLQAGGSTAGAAGIRLAYRLAHASFKKGAVNRIILATDGDFNVGITNRHKLKGFVERKRKQGIFLSVLGFGQGNYHDQMMQVLAQNGNGVAAYIDTLSEAQKVLIHEATSNLFPIAKDVKIQVEFNPDTVAEYRLIGYETRHLEREDFNNDAVDAGDIGAGHTVTAIYEITPVDSEAQRVDKRRYAKKAPAEGAVDFNNEYAFLKIRYKLPDEDTSKLITQPIGKELARPNSFLQQETRFATAVAAFAQLLRGGKYTGDFSYDDVIELAQASKGEDLYGYRTEFIQLVRKAKIAAPM